MKCRACGKEMQYPALYCSAGCRENYDGVSVPVETVTANGAANRAFQDDTANHRREAVTPVSVTGRGGRKCDMCGKPLHWRKRSDARFCDASCRKRYSRRGNRANRSLDGMQYGLSPVKQALEKYPDLRPELVKRLHRLQKQIDDLLSEYDLEIMQ